MSKDISVSLLTKATLEQQLADQAKRLEALEAALHKCGDCEAKLVELGNKLAALEARLAEKPAAPAVVEEKAAEPEPAPAEEKGAEPEPAPVPVPVPIEEKAVEPEPAPVEEKAAEPAPAPAEEKAVQPEPEPAPVEEKAAEPAPTPVEEKAAEPAPAPVEEKAAEPAPAPVEEKPAEPVPANTKPDDLKVIEGIGPKISELMIKAGIGTFRQMAAASFSQLKAVLTAGGSRFRTADPTSWPAQAKLAAEGKWDALTTLQSKLRGGR